MPTWTPSPHSTDSWQDDHLIDEKGVHIARVEDFDNACYPSAINAKTGNLERGGAYTDRVAAMLWAERVAGVHPEKTGDERPPFYYSLDNR